MYSYVMFTFFVALKSGLWGLFNIDSVCKLKINDGHILHEVIKVIVHQNEQTRQCLIDLCSHATNESKRQMIDTYMSANKECVTICTQKMTESI